MVMTQALRKLSITLALLLACAAARAATDAATAELLMRGSGLWAQLASIGPQVRLGFDDALSQSGQRATSTELDRLARVVDKAYDTDRLRMVALTVLRDRTRTQHVPALRAWLASPSGQRIVQREEAAARRVVEPEAALRDGLALLEAMPAERQALLRDLVVAARMAEAMVELTIRLGAAIQQGVASVAPGGAPAAVANAGFVVDLERHRPRMMEAFSALSLASAASAYAGLDTADLKRYLAFVKSPAGRHWLQLVDEAFQAAMVDASVTFGRSLPASRDIAHS